MSIYSSSMPGTSFRKSRFTRSISNRIDYDCKFHQLVPVLKRFVLPGDVWRIGGEVLVRFHPMLSPTLTPNNFRVRYYFVPLRLVEPNAELVITGSKDGHLYTGTLPVLDNFLANANTSTSADAFKVLKHSFWDYMNVQTGDYTSISTDECLPAAYWMKGNCSIFWNFYDDENLGYHNAFADYQAFEDKILEFGGARDCFDSCISKDYFTSSLPWQLKGVAPRIDVTGTATFTPAYSGSLINFNNTDYIAADPLKIGTDFQSSENQLMFNNRTLTDDVNDEINNYLNKPQSVSITQLGFTAADERIMMAQTRIFERLARCGSRYTEFLRSNFGIAPADETLQRPQYLGGWKVPIITTEVLQTAADGANPVGTMRGHGITRGGQRIHTFYAKEFGMLFGFAEVRPDIQYTTGIPRQLTYKRRFDFFNPSFQHLSEQEVRNGELFISNSDGLNDDTFGFQAYANELRSSPNETVGDLRDSLSFWNQALHFTSRPNLNNAFVSGASHRASFNAPFAISSPTAFPIIVQFYNHLDVYRPMVRYATPGLVDHL